MGVQKENNAFILTFGESDRTVEVDVEIVYYKTAYGEDADGNRGIPLMALDDYTIEIPNSCLDGTVIDEMDRKEIYKEAKRVIRENWQDWTREA
jgi:hypothetical protein